MIRYDEENRVVIMNLVDLEHCGFDVDDYHNELFIAGLDRNTGARQPLALIVCFSGGHVVTSETYPPVLERLRHERKLFNVLLEKLGIESSTGG